LLGLASARIVRAFVFFEVRWCEALLRGQIEEQAISKEVHRDPCPRCGNPMQIREYTGLNEKEERRPSFYTRWFCCMNKACKTTFSDASTLQGCVMVRTTKRAD
jgi:hypothetical protein